MPFEPFTFALGAASVAAAAVALKVATALGVVAGSSLYVATAVAAGLTGAAHYKLTHADEKPFEEAARVIRSTKIACSFTISIGPEGCASHYHFELRDYSAKQLGLKFRGEGHHSLKKVSNKYYHSLSRGSPSIVVDGWNGEIGMAATNHNALIDDGNIEGMMIEASLLSVASAVAFAYHYTSWGSGCTGWVTYSDTGGIWVWPRVTPTTDNPYTGDLSMRLHCASKVRDIICEPLRFA